MCSQTCGYVVSKDDSEWDGEDSSEFWLDRDPEDGGLGISEWHCPHPPFEEEGGDEKDDDEKRCVFHTDADVPTNRQRTELLDALDDAGEGPCDDRPEHRGQFVGATFGAIDLSGETIAATENHDIRFDHAQFQADNEDLNFARTTFIAQGQHPVSLVGAEFITEGGGNVWFPHARFRTDGDGDVWSRFTGSLPVSNARPYATARIRR